MKKLFNSEFIYFSYLSCNVRSLHFPIFIISVFYISSDRVSLNSSTKSRNHMVSVTVSFCDLTMGTQAIKMTVTVMVSATVSFSETQDRHRD